MSNKTTISSNAPLREIKTRDKRTQLSRARRLEFLYSLNLVKADPPRLAHVVPFKYYDEAWSSYIDGNFIPAITMADKAVKALVIYGLKIPINIMGEPIEGISNPYDMIEFHRRELILTELDEYVRPYRHPDISMFDRSWELDAEEVMRLLAKIFQVFPSVNHDHEWVQ